MFKVCQSDPPAASCLAVCCPLQFWRFHEILEHPTIKCVIVVSGLLGVGYTETAYTEDGHRVTTAPRDIVSFTSSSHDSSNTF